MRELDKVLDPNEKVLWESKPEFLPFVLGSSIGVTVFSIFWMILLIPFIVLAIHDILFGSRVWGIFMFLMPHFWLGLGMLFGVPIYKFFVYKHTYYAITDKRAILQTGIIGRDFELVDFDQVTNIEVDVGVFDKILGTKDTGSITFSTAGSIGYSGNGSTIHFPHTFRNVKNPYDVFKLLRKVSLDVRADISFPNKMRPSENPGYETNYTQPDIK